MTPRVNGRSQLAGGRADASQLVGCGCLDVCMHVLHTGIHECRGRTNKRARAGPCVPATPSSIHKLQYNPVPFVYSLITQVYAPYTRANTQYTHAHNLGKHPPTHHATAGLALSRWRTETRARYLSIFRSSSSGQPRATRISPNVAEF